MPSSSLRALLVAGGKRVCALPLAGLRETMRPLPVEAFPGAPEFVLGLSLVRGASLPVIELGKLLDPGAPSGAVRRYVTLKLPASDIALAVTDVLGIEELDPEQLSRLPSLVDNARLDFVEALSAHHAQLLTLLSVARIVPQELLASLLGRGART